MATKKISQLETISDANLSGEAILPVVVSDPLIPNRKAKKNAAGTFPTKDLFAIYKQKKSWNKSTASWNDPTTDNDPKTYAHELIIDHVEDVIFNPNPDKQMKELSEFIGYDIRMISPDFGNA